MFNSKNTKRSLLMSALALVLCVSMLVGSTFAWFTDTASTSVNKIQSGTLDIQLLMYDGANWVSAEGETLNFIAADGNQNILWEPGCTYKLPALKVVNKGNLELKYQIHITGIEGDAKLLEVIDFTIEGEDALTGTLAPNAETPSITLIGHMAEEAGNEYQGKTMDAISITVVATQLNAENDTYGPDYDEDAWHPAMKVYNAGDLQAAINNADAVILMNDVETDEVIVFNSDVALNLNGNTVNASFEMSEDVNVSIVNGQIVNDNADVSGIQVNKGNLTLSNVEITSARHAVRVEGGEVTINGGTYKAAGSAGKTQHALNVSDGGKVVINGGTFVGPKGTASDSGSAVNVQAGSTVTINGGNFSGGKLKTLAANGSLTVKGGTFDQDPTAYVAAGYAAEKNAEGNYVVLFPQSSFDALIDGAQAGETVEIPAGTYTFPASKLKEGMTLNCAPGTVFEGKTSLNINGATVVGATFTNDNDYLVNSTTINGTFKDCVFTNSDGLRYCYAGETVVFENCVFDTDFYGVHFDGGANDVVFKNCTFSGFNTFGSAVTKLTMEGCTFEYNGKGGYNGVNLWGNTDMIDCTFVFDGSARYEWVDLCGDNQTVTFTNCVVTDGKTEKGIETVVGNYGMGNSITIDGEELCIASDSDVLADAITNGATEIQLGSGEYIIPDSASNKTLTIIGNGDTVVAAQDDGAAEGDCDYSFQGSTVTFENLTITTSTTYLPGYARMKGIYNNCTINGVWTLYDNSEFNNCTFNVSGDVYNVWTWGAAVATFNNCTFNNDGKALLLYGTANTKLTLNGCTFNDNGGLTDLKAAVEIGNDYGKSYELIVNNTVVNGYEINDKGINTGSTLWANKNSMGTDKLNVVIDGVDVY